MRTGNRNCSAFWKLTVSTQRYFSQGEPDLYKVLGLNPDASPEEIKRAYYKLAKLKHPDLCSNKPQAHREFTQLQHAYSVLSDPNKRRLHDRQQDIEDRLYESTHHFHRRQRRSEQRVYEEPPSHFRQRQERAKRMTEEHQKQQQQRPPKSGSQSREQAWQNFDEAYKRESQNYDKTYDFDRFMKHLIVENLGTSAEKESVIRQHSTRSFSPSLSYNKSMSHLN